MMTRLSLALALLGVPALARATPGFDGTYRVVSISDGKQTVAMADVMKRANGKGEAVLSFSAGTLSLGLWAVGKDEKPDRPGQALFSACRAQQTMTPAWDGDRFLLTSKLAVNGWSGAFHVSKSKRGRDTKRATWSREQGCSFSLDKGSYAVTVLRSDASGATDLTLTNGNSVLQLERTVPIDKVDIAAAVGELE